MTTATLVEPKKPVVGSLDKCFDAVEDYLNGKLSKNQYLDTLQKLGFTPEGLEKAYQKQVANYHQEI